MYSKQTYMYEHIHIYTCIYYIKDGSNFKERDQLLINTAAAVYI